MVENVRVPANKDAVDTARDVKEQMDETWSDVFLFYAEYREPIDERIEDLMTGDGEPVAEVTPEVSLDVDTVADALQQALGDVEADLDAEVREQFDRIESAATTAEDRTGQIQRELEDMTR